MYSRRRIISNYRRITLYSLDRIIEDKIAQKDSFDTNNIIEQMIRLREEISNHILLKAFNKIWLWGLFITPC